MSKVYLVGAGPGDPDLLTLKGLDVLRQAEVVLYDNLAGHEILDHVPPAAEKIYVGKKRANHALSQDEISHLLVEYARAGKRVVRLKGGDPYIFGRGGEEAEALKEAGIPYEVVPGVTVALGMAAYTGVPLTHREHTSSVTFVTGHAPEKIDWTRVGHAETLVIYMGLTTIGEIARRLIAAGRSPDVPAMAVRWATRSNQQTVSATLGTIADVVEQAHIRPPATILIGEVASLRGKLDWYEHLPLFGRTVVITRAAGQATELSRRLRAQGAHAVEIPTIEIRPPQDAAPLRKAINELEQYDWLLFTSPNGVNWFLRMLDESGRDLRAIRGQLCAIGPGTAAIFESLHLKVDLIPERFVAEGILDAFAERNVAGKRMLLARAAVARDVLPEELRRRGAQVDVVEAYRTEVPVSSQELLREVEHADWVTFTSSSTVKNFLALGGRRLLDNGARVASIGPVTSDTCRMHGITISVEARRHTIDGIVEAIVESATSS